MLITSWEHDKYDKDCALYRADHITCILRENISVSQTSVCADAIFASAALCNPLRKEETVREGS